MSIFRICSQNIKGTTPLRSIESKIRSKLDNLRSVSFKYSQFQPETPSVMEEDMANEAVYALSMSRHGNIVAKESDAMHVLETLKSRIDAARETARKEVALLRQDM